jgi:hypothetical protein
MTDVEVYARAAQQKRITSAISEAMEYDLRTEQSCIRTGRIIIGRHRDLFLALAAAVRDDAIWDALAQCRQAFVLERDADVALELGREESFR